MYFEGSNHGNSNDPRGFFFWCFSLAPCLLYSRPKNLYIFVTSFKKNPTVKCSPKRHEPYKVSFKHYRICNVITKSFRYYTCPLFLIKKKKIFQIKSLRLCPSNSLKRQVKKFIDKRNDKIMFNKKQIQLCKVNDYQIF